MLTVYSEPIQVTRPVQVMNTVHRLMVIGVAMDTLMECASLYVGCVPKCQEHQKSGYCDVQI